MGTSSSFAVLLTAVLAGASPDGTPVDIFESQAELTPQNKIDELVFARLSQLGIRPANLCSDAAFVRRVHLDVIGTLPTASEASQFLTDADPDKRRKLIDRLLERKGFAEYWAMKWADLLRVKAEFPINLWPNAAQAYHRWICDSVCGNKPYDRFVRELLTSSGSNFRVPPVNFYRAIQGKEPQAIAQAVALTFLGERVDKWPKERRDGMTAFFSYVGFKPSKEWKEEIVFFDLEKAMEQPPGDSLRAIFPDGTPAKLSPEEDPREVFADWLIRAENPWFARNVVNRVWYWLLGRGIIHEPDDCRHDNPASNPELLAFLEKELVAARFDLKHVYRLILSSTTYQLSSAPKSRDPQAAAHFAYYPVRRLEAEVLVDALCQITGTTEKYSSPIPEPFTFIPENRRSIALADGSITSSFLEMFGRPPRDTGLESERNNEPTPAQRLHFLNSSHVQRKLREGPRIQSVIQSNRSREETAKQLYLMIVSRFPTKRELKIVAEYSQSGVVEGREGLEDLAWALINSAEFLHRH
ncbi:MAG: DUF1553 domain-containing protein [Planctomycetota bacterium]|jgi:hypothetical protein